MSASARAQPAAVALPGAPVSLTATASSTSQISLSWAASDSRASGYIIERVSNGSTFTQVGKTSKKNFNDSGLATNTTYSYRVTAYNSAGSSAPSATVSATTKNKAPGVPTGVTATVVSSSQINLAWNAADSLATGYFIERATGTTFTKIATVTARTYSDTGLAANTTYTYRVTAFNAIGNSPASSTVSAKTSVALPAVPTNLTATTVSQTQINLAWSTTDSLATGYTIERSVSGGAFTQIASVTTKTYSNIGLTAGLTYTYRVKAFNASGPSAASATATATTTSNAPAAPVSLVATPVSISQINLSWSTTDSLATGYLVQRSLAGGAYVQVANITTKSFNDVGLAEGTAYSYRVIAYNGSGSSAASTTATATTLKRPASPTSLIATATSISQINLSWSTTDSLATGYLVQRSLAGGAYVQVADVSTKTFSDIGLAEGSAYTYRVIAYNGNGSSAASSTATATTLKRPAVPTSLIAAATSVSQISLTWSTTDSLATGYIVERSAGAGFSQVANVTTKSYLDIGLTEGATYTYRVSAYNTAGNSASSGTAAATTLRRPGTPVGLVAVAAGISQINLSWSAADGLATGFRVERSLNGGAFAQVADVSTTTLSDSGLAEGATYTYRVTAYGAGGSSSASATASATTSQRPGTPLAPVTTSISTSEISVTWNTPDALATGFIVERSSGGAFAQVADVSQKLFNDSGLAEGATYTYRVTAYNTFGSSASVLSAPVATLRRPGTPTNVTAAAAGISQINLAWTPADSYTSGYVVERSLDGDVYTQVADVTTNSYNDTGLFEGATYLYRITAHGPGGSSAASSIVTTDTLRRPATPTSLSATPATSSQINVKWTAGDALATGYTVERSTSGGAYAMIGNVTTTTFGDSGLTGNVAYTYRITAYNAGGSLAGATVTTTIKIPGTPNTMAAKVATTTQISLTWKPADSVATGYFVERSADGSTFTQIADVTTASYSSTGLTPGSTYWYRVTAHNALGNSPTSAVVFATVPFPPQPATNLIATTVDANGVDLTWSAGDVITTGYAVERSADNGVTFTQIATVSGPSYSDRGLVGSTTYVYRVKATTAFGSSVASATATATTLEAPLAPTGLTAATISTTEIDLTWTAVDPAATGYFVERSTNFGAFVKVADLPVTDIAPTSFADTGLAQNTIYVYRVSAYFAQGYAASQTAQSTTLADPPPAPPAERPSATNTGVDPDVILTTVNAFKPVSNSSYSNLLIKGQMSMSGLKNITFTNCVFDANGAAYDVRCDGATNITIQHCELKNANAAGIYGDGYNAIDNYVHQIGGDGFKAGNNTFIYGNYITDLGYLAIDPHADGVQVAGATHVIIVGNFFDTPIDQPNTECNSAFFLQYASRDVIFSGNWVIGGNYAVHAYADGGGGSTVQIINNVFYTGTVRYGFGSIGSGVIWQDNVTETGLPALKSSK